MKKYIVLVFALLLFTFAYAEAVVETDKNLAASDTVTIDKEEEKEEEEASLSDFPFDGFNWWESKKEKRKHNAANKRAKAKEPHWAGLGFAFTNLDNLNDANLNLSNSRSFNLNLWDYTIPLSRHWLLASGIGMDFTRYSFKGNTGLWEDADGFAYFEKDANNRTYEVNKLSAYYVVFPLLLEFQTRGAGKKFFVNGGVEGIVKFYSKSQLSIMGGENINFRNLNILPVNFRLALRVGFGRVGFFGYYQPVPMFKSGNGPAIRPYGIGIALN